MMHASRVVCFGWGSRLEEGGGCTSAAVIASWILDLGSWILDLKS